MGIFFNSGYPETILFVVSSLDQSFSFSLFHRGSISLGPSFCGTLSCRCSHFSCPKFQAQVALWGMSPTHQPTAPSSCPLLVSASRGFLDSLLSLTRFQKKFIDGYILSRTSMCFLRAGRSVSGHSTKLLWVWRYQFACFVPNTW